MVELLIGEALDELADKMGNVTFNYGIFDTEEMGLGHLTGDRELKVVAMATVEVLSKKIQGDDLVKAAFCTGFHLGAKAQEIYERQDA